jgi:hypothetical protein
MNSKWITALLLLTAALAFACGGSPKAAPGAAGGQLAVAAGDFGVPECDRYMKNYMACIDAKVPEAARAMLRQALDQSKAAWKQAAATAQGRANLASACTQAEAAAKQSMQAYGCQW